MATALSDLRHALRVLTRHKAFTLAAVGILTLAIGANIAIFTLVSDTLLRPLPLPDSARLVRIEERHAGRSINLTGATFVDLQQQATTLTAVAAYRLTSPGFSTSRALKTLALALTVHLGDKTNPRRSDPSLFP